MPFSFADHPDPHVRELYELLEGGNVPEPAPEPKSAKPAQEPNGRFAPDNKGGPGNPHARQTAQLRALALKFVDEAKMLKLLEVLFESATAGNLAAIRLLLQYTLGKPLAGTNPDQVEVEEWKLHQKSSHPAKDLETLLHSLPADYLNNAARNVWPILVAQVTGACAEQLRSELQAQTPPAPAKPGAPSPNGGFPTRPPSPNGIFGSPPPSPNGIFGSPPPSPNGIFQPPPADTTISPANLSMPSASRPRQPVFDDPARVSVSGSDK